MDSYQFTDLAELRDFLNQFKESDLSTYWPDDAHNYLHLELKNKVLSDGSEVTNFTFKMT